MKHLVRILSLIMVVTLSVSFMGCGSDDDSKSETDQQIEKLNGTWKVTSVTYEDQDVTDDYKNFTITFTAAAGSKSIGYVTDGRAANGGPWLPSGTFDFGAKPSTELIREDDTEFTYSVSGTNLELDFNYEGEIHVGRTESVGGDWSFKLAKQ